MPTSELAAVGLVMPASIPACGYAGWRPRGRGYQGIPKPHGDLAGHFDTQLQQSRRGVPVKLPVKPALRTAGHRMPYGSDDTRARQHDLLLSPTSCYCCTEATVKRRSLHGCFQDSERSPPSRSRITPIIQRMAKITCSRPQFQSQQLHAGEQTHGGCPTLRVDAYHAHADA